MNESVKPTKVGLGAETSAAEHHAVVPATDVSGTKISSIRRFLDAVGAKIRRLRRWGVPHEETVIIPALAMYATLRVSTETGWQFYVPTLAVGAVWFACGVWLGLTWRGFPVLKVILRALYASTLSVVLYCLYDGNVTRVEAIKSVSLIFGSLGLMFYFGHLYGALTRDISLKIFYSEKQKNSYLARRAWFSYIWRLVREQEDKNKASGWDWAASMLVKSCLDVKGLVIIFGLLFSALWYVWVFSKWLIPDQA